MSRWPILLLAFCPVVCIAACNKDKASDSKDKPSNGSATGSSSETRSSNPSQDSAKGSLPVWAPEAKYRDQLGPVSDVLDKFQINVPKDYKVVRIEELYKTTELRPPRLDLQPLIALSLEDKYFLKESELASRIAENVDTPLRGVGYTDVKKGKVESGSLAGGTFSRIHFTASGNDKKMSGFWYEGICGDSLIKVHCYADEPATEDDLKLLEASVLTLRSK